MNRNSRSYLVGALSLALLGCTAGALSLSDEVRVVDIPDRGVVLTYPAGWHLAEENLTPNLGDPREVFSLGSFHLTPGGPNCAQVPSQALHDFEATDVFVTVQERSATKPTGFDPRPENFGPTPGDTNHVFCECLEPEERADVSKMHWIWFSDQDRYFHILVALGRDATPEAETAIWSTLDRLVIEPRD
jgi:hypothetical protein